MHSNLNQYSGFALTGNPAPFYFPEQGFLRRFHRATFGQGQLGRLSAGGAPSLSVTGQPTPPGTPLYVLIIIAVSGAAVKLGLKEIVE